MSHLYMVVREGALGDGQDCGWPLRVPYLLSGIFVVHVSRCEVSCRRMFVTWMLKLSLNRGARGGKDAASTWKLFVRIRTKRQSRSDHCAQDALPEVGTTLQVTVGGTPEPKSEHPRVL
jgi:hypothetical protein